jgi:hypothetical protein
MYRGHKYDSKAEAHYAELLDNLLEQGKIKSIDRQRVYKLPNMEGKPRMRYMADFVVVGNSGVEYIIDVKGMCTPEMKVKMAYFQYVHNKKVHIVFTTGLEAFRTEFLV